MKRMKNGKKHNTTLSTVHIKNRRTFIHEHTIIPSHKHMHTHACIHAYIYIQVSYSYGHTFICIRFS